MSLTPFLLLLLPLGLVLLQIALRKRLGRAERLRERLKHDRPPSSGLLPWATEVDLASCPLLGAEAFLAPLDARGHYLVVDTETQDAIEPTDDEAPAEDLPTPSPVIALSWQVLDEEGRLLHEEYHLLQRTGTISATATAIHRLREQDLRERGQSPAEVYTRFLRDLQRTEVLVAHHLRFHRAMLLGDFQALGLPSEALASQAGYCTMEAGKTLGFKHRTSGEALYPRLGELFGYLYYGRPHLSVRYDAKAVHDVRLCAACLRALRQLPAYLPREAFTAPSAPRPLHGEN